MGFDLVPYAGEQELDSYFISWEDDDGQRQSRDLSGIAFSDRELGISCMDVIPAGRVIRVKARDESKNGVYVVRDCWSRGGGYLVTAEFVESANFRESAPDPDFEGKDLYEILQINPKADAETINRVFRIMAARFHPDNPETGDEERFRELKRAHTILSDPARRAAYDEYRENRVEGPLPVFEHKDFVVGIESEMNRRLGVLSLLYDRRRVNQDHPGVSLLDLEQKMDLPREVLGFAMWYLRAKQFVSVADNSDYTITAEGADFLENNAGSNEHLASFLSGGSRTVPTRRKANGGGLA